MTRQNTLKWNGSLRCRSMSNSLSCDPPTCECWSSTSIRTSTLSWERSWRGCSSMPSSRKRWGGGGEGEERDARTCRKPLPLVLGCVYCVITTTTQLCTAQGWQEIIYALSFLNFILCDLGCQMRELQGWQLTWEERSRKLPSPPILSHQHWLLAYMNIQHSHHKQNNK